MNTIGERIRKRREELGLTQDELAKKLGYANRSSVNKVETSRELSNKKVYEYAKALETTPAYIMGWEEKLDEKADIAAKIFIIALCIRLLMLMIIGLSDLQLSLASRLISSKFLSK